MIQAVHCLTKVMRFCNHHDQRYDSNSLKFRLIVVAIVHAILLGVVFTALHNKPAQPQPEQSWTVPNYRPTSPSVGTIEKLQEPQSVNLQAQGEIKQQIRNCPPNCLPQRVYPAPVVVQPTIVQPTVVTPTVTPTVAPPVPAAPNFVDTQKPTQEPLVVTPVSTLLLLHRRRATRSPCSLTPMQPVSDFKSGSRRTSN